MRTLHYIVEMEKKKHTDEFDDMANNDLWEKHYQILMEIWM